MIVLKTILNIFKISVTFAFRNYLKIRFPNVIFPKSVSFYGIPLFSFSSTAKVIIEPFIIFTSDPRANYVGLSKRCSVYVGPKASLFLGRNSGFSGVSIFCSKNVYIGTGVNVGGNCSIWDTDFHPINFLHRQFGESSQTKAEAVFIGNNVFIGANSIILKGVRIGDRSIIGAGSVVTKSIPSDQMWAGNPAKYIRTIDKKDVVS